MDKKVEEKFESYPPEARKRLDEIRNMIFEIADEEDLGVITEELKWGEPSYSSKTGSPIRVDWKPKNPRHVSLFVNCKTILIETYKELYPNTFTYIGNRELTIALAEPLAKQELRCCISIALRYHKIKKLPLLGA